MVKCFIKDEETRWDRHISFVTAAYRSSVHEATGMTPNFLMLGREPRMPLDMIFEESKTNQVCSKEDYVLELKRKLEKVHDIARSKLKKITMTNMFAHSFTKLGIKSYIYRSV